MDTKKTENRWEIETYFGILYYPHQEIIANRKANQSGAKRKRTRVELTARKPEWS